LADILECQPTDMFSSKWIKVFIYLCEVDADIEVSEGRRV